MTWNTGAPIKYGRSGSPTQDLYLAPVWCFATSLRMMLIRKRLMVSKVRWKEDVKSRWTSSWINVRQLLTVASTSSELVWPHQVNYQIWFFPQKNCIYSHYVLFQDSAKRVSVKRDSAKCDWTNMAHTDDSIEVLLCSVMAIQRSRRSRTRLGANLCWFPSDAPTTLDGSCQRLTSQREKCCICWSTA